MVYVIADIHGQLKEYRMMLEKIRFCEEDTLYILGDLCDRGPDSAKLYLDVMSRKNVFCIKGNHEDMLLETLPFYYGFIKKHKQVERERFYNAEIWGACGGETTLCSFLSLSQEEVLGIYRYIEELPCYRELQVGERSFLLVHGGLDGFTPERPMEDYLIEELVWCRPDFDRRFWLDQQRYLLVGHTPTFTFLPSRKGCIYHGKGDVIAVDCGAAYPFYGGRLGCLCLDTMEEYYVDFLF